MPIFSWPKLSKYRGEVVVSGWHTSQTTTTYADHAVSATVFVTMAGIAVGTFFYQLSLGRSPGTGIALGLFLGMLGIFPGGILGLTLYPFFWLLFRPVTIVRVTADAVIVDGMPYTRGDVPINFSSMSTSAVGLHRTESSQTMVGTFDESKSLRLFYGSNPVLVTTFVSAEKAGRFALACNSALSQMPIGKDAASNSITVHHVPQQSSATATALPVGVRRVLPGR